MANPSPTTRSSPGGIQFWDGYQSLITLASDPDIEIWEMEITPPAEEGGDAIGTTSMHNTAWHTKRPQSLKMLEDFSIVCGYASEAYSSIRAQINNETTITIALPDGSTDAFFGYLKRFERAALQIGTLPTATATFVVTNWDAANDVEAGPTFANVAGT